MQILHLVKMRLCEKRRSCWELLSEGAPRTTLMQESHERSLIENCSSFIVRFATSLYPSSRILDPPPSFRYCSCDLEAFLPTNLRLPPAHYHSIPSWLLYVRRLKQSSGAEALKGRDLTKNSKLPTVLNPTTTTATTFLMEELPQSFLTIPRHFFRIKGECYRQRAVESCA